MILLPESKRQASLLPLKVASPGRRFGRSDRSSAFVRQHNLSAEMQISPSGDYDVVIVGSGFGGSMAAVPLVDAGLRVLMLERGEWVRRGAENWGDRGVFVLTSHYADGGHALRTRRGWRPQGICACVGGPSVFYGGASFRFREADFQPPAEISDGSAADWPIAYDDLEQHYCRAEELLRVAGEAGRDPTEPRRSAPYPSIPMTDSTTGLRVSAAAEALGLRPFRIPMAIDGDSCQSCITCDAFACAVEAKNDLATRVIPGLIARGMELATGTIAVRLKTAHSSVREVEILNVVTGARSRVRARNVVLAAGALASPQLILASELDRSSPAPEAIGRFLTRHCNAMVYGYFRGHSRPAAKHHKQVAIHDFYFGDPAAPGFEKLGNIQQVMTPPASLVRAMLPRAAGWAATALISRMTGLLVIAEDQPRRENRVELDRGHGEVHGLPRARITHRYTARDLAARGALLTRARQILKEAGASFTVTWPVNTFSHALGTLRMGRDPATSPVDRSGRFRGVDNLWVADGSVFPTSGGVNPSLTIAANALRVGTVVAAAA